jgi:hypothetical protein
MRERITRSPDKGRHALYIADEGVEPLVVIHQHVRYAGPDEGAEALWAPPLIEVRGGRFTMEDALDVFGALTTGLQKADEWEKDVGHPVVPLAKPGENG